LEPHFDLVPCFNNAKAHCCIAPVCKLKGVLHEAQTAFMGVLEHYTLADVLQNQNELTVLLNINPLDK
jgi:Rrf2 family nitric oxide-sensitive transcriptional repressor